MISHIFFSTLTLFWYRSSLFLRKPILCNEPAYQYHLTDQSILQCLGRPSQAFRNFEKQLLESHRLGNVRIRRLSQNGTYYLRMYRNHRLCRNSKQAVKYRYITIC